MSHTPGPWAVEGESGNDGEAEVIVSDKRTVCWTACSLNEDDDDFTSDEDRANAFLIAAAPELLAALKGMLEKFGSTVMPGEAGTDAVEAAVVAIHKAEGKVE